LILASCLEVMFGVVECGTGKQFFLIQAPYDTTIILEHFAQRKSLSFLNDVLVP
jgi:hypothetical protein